MMYCISAAGDTMEEYMSNMLVCSVVWCLLHQQFKTLFFIQTSHSVISIMVCVCVPVQMAIWIDKSPGLTSDPLYFVGLLIKDV